MPFTYDDTKSQINAATSTNDLIFQTVFSREFQSTDQFPSRDVLSLKRQAVMKHMLLNPTYEFPTTAFDGKHMQAYAQTTMNVTGRLSFASKLDQTNADEKAALQALTSISVDYAKLKAVEERLDQQQLKLDQEQEQQKIRGEQLDSEWEKAKAAVNSLIAPEQQPVRQNAEATQTTSGSSQQQSSSPESDNDNDNDNDNDDDDETDYSGVFTVVHPKANTDGSPSLVQQFTGFLGQSMQWLRPKSSQQKSNSPAVTNSVAVSSAYVSPPTSVIEQGSSQNAANNNVASPAQQQQLDSSAATNPVAASSVYVPPPVIDAAGTLPQNDNDAAPSQHLIQKESDDDESIEQMRIVRSRNVGDIIGSAVVSAYQSLAAIPSVFSAGNKAAAANNASQYGVAIPASDSVVAVDATTGASQYAVAIPVDTTTGASPAVAAISRANQYAQPVFIDDNSSQYRSVGAVLEDLTETVLGAEVSNEFGIYVSTADVARSVAAAGVGVLSDDDDDAAHGVDVQPQPANQLPLKDALTQFIESASIEKKKIFIAATKKSSPAKFRQ